MSLGCVLLASNNLYVLTLGRHDHRLGFKEEEVLFMVVKLLGKVINCNALLTILVEKAQASNNITFIILLTRTIHAQITFPLPGN